MCQTYTQFIGKTTTSTKVPNCEHCLVIAAHLPLPVIPLGSMDPTQAAQFYCRGCKTNFTFTGYSQHVAKTQRPNCRAVHALESSPFQNSPTAVSQSQVDSGSSLNPFFNATHHHSSPADHPTPMIGHEADHDISVSNQTNGARNGEVVFYFMITATANLGLCFRS